MQRLFEGAVWTDQPDEQPNELRGILQYNATTGRLYIFGDDSTLRTAEVRQHLLSGEWAPASHANLSAALPPLSLSILHPTLELDITATSFAINRSGTYAVVGGPTLADPEVAAAYLLDLTIRSTSKNTSTTPEIKSGEIRAIPLDSQLFSTHPGLHIVQMTWHPDSDSHVAVLTTDSTLRLYDLGQPELPEQTFELPNPISTSNDRRSRRRGLGLNIALQDNVEQFASVGPFFTSFAYGQGTGWDRFALYFMNSIGEMYTLCPVVPFGTVYTKGIIDSLRASLEVDVEGQHDGRKETTTAWLHRAFVTDATTSRRVLNGIPDVEACRPHALDDHSVALCGPLPILSVAHTTASTGSLAYVLKSNKDSAGGNNGINELFFENFVLWRFGGVGSAVAAISATGPVAVSVVTGGAIPKWTASAPQCITDEETLQLQAVKSQVELVGEQERSSAGGHALLLIDVVSLNSGNSSASGLHTEENEGRTGGSTQALLTINRASTDCVYAVFATKCYSISLPWIPVLAEHLAASSNNDSMSSKSRLPDALPAPRAELIHAPTHGITAAASVGDALCGSGLVVLHGDGTHSCVRASGTHSTTAARGEMSPSKGKDGWAGKSSDEDQSLKEIDAQIDRIYNSIRDGPQSAVPSTSTSATTNSTKTLADAVAVLRTSHVEFHHRAHHDLSERLEQLKNEVSLQQERSSKVEDLVERVQGAGGRLQAALEKAAWIADNLSKRLHILAELHWAVPKGSSEAEKAFKREELPRMEAAARRVAEEVDMIRGRVEALVNSGSAQSNRDRNIGGTVLSPAQLRKVRELLAEHDRAIRAAQLQLNLLKTA